MRRLSAPPRLDADRRAAPAGRFADRLSTPLPRDSRSVAIGAVVGSVVGLVVGSPLLVIAPVLAVGGWSHWRRSAAVAGARRQLAADLPPLLDDLSQRLKAGSSLSQAVRSARGTELVEARLRPLRAGLLTGLGLAASLGRLRRALATDTDHPPTLDLLAGTLDVLVTRGGPVLPSLERLHDTVRSAEWIDAEMRTQAGQATASAVALAGLPALFAIGLAALDHRLARFYLDHPLGAVCLAVAALLSYIGWWWINRLMRPDPVLRSPTRHRSPPTHRPPETTGVRSSLPALAVAGVVLVLAWTVTASPIVALVLAGALVASSRSLARRANRVADRALAEALPSSIDLCTVVLGAGGTIRDCLEALAEHGPAPVRSLAADALRRADRGQRLDQALRWFQAELGPAFQPLTGALLLAREQGGSIGELLARLSVEANASRRRLGELRARRLPVALLVPLVTCSLPAVLVGTVIPLALVALADLTI